MSDTAAYERLVAKGCLCGTERPQDCTLHGPSDNRGLRAWFLAGMPDGFPFVAFCELCGSEGLMYPNVELDDPEHDATYKPTLACPCCSGPSSERALRAEAERFGHRLNARTVFGAAA